jgi:hypothetical protein
MWIVHRNCAVWNCYSLCQFWLKLIQFKPDDCIYINNIPDHFREIICYRKNALSNPWLYWGKINLFNICNIFVHSYIPIYCCLYFILYINRSPIMFKVLWTVGSACKADALAVHWVQDLLLLWGDGEGGEKTCRFTLSLLTSCRL